MKRCHIPLLIVTVILSLLSGTTLAGPPGWNQLSPSEQKALQNHRKGWSEYPEQRREKLIEGTRRYQQMSPEERRRLQRARDRYRQMDPQERQRLRQRYLHSRDR